ncbi:MAG: polyprenol monophosphomannose synthase [Planctomycetaceae bacterium]
MPRLSVIVPTFCEADNLPELAERLFSSVSQEPYDTELIIVDDNSPDETRSICQALSQRFPVRLHVRTVERGLSSAVIEGIRNATGEILVVMDADLSHPPEAVPELVAALENPRTDFVIGSRYVRGGSTDEDWGILRFLNSKLATLLATPLTRAADPMAGFFGLRRETFEAAEQLNPIGYKIGLELMIKCRCQGVVEVPIHFANRKCGTSKLTLKEQLNYIRHLTRLYTFQLTDRQASTALPEHQAKLSSGNRKRQTSKVAF